jgi:hypothetical protein
MPRSTWLISSSTSPLVLFTLHLELAGVYCVINIYRNYCMSPSHLSLPSHFLPLPVPLPIHSILAACIEKGK